MRLRSAGKLDTPPVDDLMLALAGQLTGTAKYCIAVSVSPSLLDSFDDQNPP